MPPPAPSPPGWQRQSQSSPPQRQSRAAGPQYQAQSPTQPPTPLHRQPSRYSAYRNAAPPPASATRYRQSGVNRQRSLTRPERQRPRPGMIRNQSQVDPVEAPVPPMHTSPQVQQDQQQRVEQSMRNRIRGYPSETRVRKQNTILGRPPASQTGGRQQAVRRELQRRASSRRKPPKAKVKMTWWAILAQIMTCCCPNWCLNTCLRKKDPLVRQAWREKLALVYIILFCCLCLAFLTFGMRLALCPERLVTNSYSFYNETAQSRQVYFRQDVSVYGLLYPYDVIQKFFKDNYNTTLNGDYEGVDMSRLFDGDSSGACKQYDNGKTGNATTQGACHVADPYGGLIFFFLPRHIYHLFVSANTNSTKNRWRRLICE